MLGRLGQAGAAAAAELASGPAQQAAKKAVTSSTMGNAGGALSGLQSGGRRPISTVVENTTMREDGTTVRNPGHIQFQTSESEREREPGLAEAIGQSPQWGRGVPRESKLVSGTLPDGKKFTVSGVTTPAKTAGQDKVLQNANTRIDHGEMTDAQLKHMKSIQDKPIFEKYETSGADESNCVHGHAKVARDVLGFDVQPEKHARPQDLGKAMEGLKIEDDSSSS